MAWFKVDDKLHDHRKSRTAGTTAMGLWVLAGSWAADNLSDGFVPESVCSRWEKQYRRLAGQLVVAGFWTEAVRDGEKGWQFHDWGSCQPTKAEVEERRAEARERMANRRRNKDGTSEDVQPNGVSTNTEVLVPVPSRPVPVVGSESEERPETLRAVPATGHPPKCSTHPNGGYDGPCGGCAKVREFDEKANRRRADQAAAARAACPRCEGMGFILDDDKKPTGRKCDPHFPAERVVGLV